MSNPFSGIITSQLKTTYKQMIEALLEGASVPCTLIYSGTKWEICPNCIPDNITGKSSNRYNGTGPIPFNNGLCPYCYGQYRIPSEATESLDLLVIWNSKDWILTNPQIKVADIACQTMSVITTYDNLMRTSRIKLNSNIQNYGVAEFVRLGHPEPLGFGEDNFIICSWGRT